MRPDEREPGERELHRDYHQWLATGQLGGLVAVEAGDLALGRADLVTDFGGLRFPTEIKRELHDASRSALESRYLAQAAEYTNINVPFGRLLVLDLTAHPRGTPRVDESIWVARHQASGGSAPRLIVVGVLRGNRPTPHDLSTRPHARGNRSSR